MLHGEQLRAARALLRWTRERLAEEAGKSEPVSVAALKKWEATNGPIRGDSLKVAAVTAALESHGVELLNHGQPGARLKAQPAQE